MTEREESDLPERIWATMNGSGMSVGASGSLRYWIGGWVSKKGGTTKRAIEYVRADRLTALLAAEKERGDGHFAEIKRAQSVVDDMKAWRAAIYNQSISADWIAVMLSEHPEPDSRSYVAVQIAEQCDKAIANAKAITESERDDWQARAEQAEAALAASEAARVKAVEALMSADSIIKRLQFFTHEEASNGPNWERIMHIEAAITEWRAALTQGATP